MNTDTIGLDLALIKIFPERETIERLGISNVNEERRCIWSDTGQIIRGQSYVVPAGESIAIDDFQTDTPGSTMILFKSKELLQFSASGNVWGAHDSPIVGEYSNSCLYFDMTGFTKKAFDFKNAVFHVYGEFDDDDKYLAVKPSFVIEVASADPGEYKVGFDATLDGTPSGQFYVSTEISQICKTILLDGQCNDIRVFNPQTTEQTFRMVLVDLDDADITSMFTGD